MARSSLSFFRSGPRFWFSSRLISTHSHPLWLMRKINDVSGSFYPASYGNFSQTPPQLYNPFIEDKFLRDYLSFKLPNEVRIDMTQLYVYICTCPMTSVLD